MIKKLFNVRVAFTLYLIRKKFFRNLYIKIKKSFFRAYLLNQHPDLLFIHIPKNAGTSIYDAMGTQGGYHLAISEILENKLLSRQELATKKTFCIVRNPFSRFASLYTFYQGTDHEVFTLGYEWRQIHKKTSKLSFYEFVEIFPKLRKEHPIYFSTQSKYIFHNDKLLIDNVLHLENINKEFQVFAKSHTLSSLPMKNNSKQKDWRDWYTPELVEKVSTFYLRDLKNFYPDAQQKLLNYLLSREK